jgi:hypothetical protein
MFTPQWQPTNEINRPIPTNITSTIIIPIIIIPRPIPLTFQPTTSI